MSMRSAILLFFSLIILCVSFTPAIARENRAFKFGGDNAVREEAQDASARPLISERFVDEGDYFFVRGKKIYLKKSVNRIAVKFKRPVLSRLQGLSGTKKLQSDFIRQTLNLTEGDTDPVIERRIHGTDISIINTRVRFPVSPQRLRSQIQAITASDAVEYAGPVFLSKTTFNEIIPTDEILVRFKPDFNRPELEDFCTRHRLTFQRATAPKLNIHVLSVNNPGTRSAVDVANALNGQEGVVWAQPNFVQKVDLDSVNDPLYPNQWHLENDGRGGQGAAADADVDAEQAWAVQTGSPNITIAIVDDGVDLRHEDLDIWTNPGEIAGNGIDDDGNGYVDDIHGWNFYDSNNNPGADYENNHGTSCAGVAAAKGNNDIGVAGIAYGSKILPVKILGGPEGGTIDGLAPVDALGAAIIYAADHADVISCSWGGMPPSDYIMDAIDYAVESGRNGKGVPVFFATGNGAARGGSVGILPFAEWPGGFLTIGWQFIKDDSGESGHDAAWLDDVFIGDMDTGAGYLERFEGVVPPNLPDSDWVTGGDGNWGSVNDPDHANGNISVKSGPIDHGQFSMLVVSKYFSDPEGYLLYRVWVDAAPGDGLLAAIHDGEEWVVYENFLGEGISFPASYANSIAVGASNDADVQSAYSQYGEEIDFVAPSNDALGHQGITTADRTGNSGYDPTNYTDSFGGTSAATPLAAGIAALMLSRDFELTAEEVRSILRASCDKIGNDAYDGIGWNKYYGFGRVNAHKALTALGPIATLTINSSGGGSVTTPGEGSFSAAYGEVITLVAAPDKGFTFQNWTGDVENPNAASTFLTLDGNKNITANFVKSGGSSSQSGGCFISSLFNQGVGQK